MKKNYKTYLLAVVLILWCYSNIYIALPISGVVVDATTEMPVSGAVVVAKWTSESPGFHSAGNELFEFQEAVTDLEGKFTIEGWYIKFLFRLWASISIRQPYLLVYKYTYEPVEFWNAYPSDSRFRHSHGTLIRWNSDTLLKIQPLMGSRIEKTQQFKFHEQKLNLIYSCELDKIKMLLLEVDKQFLDMELGAFEKSALPRDLKPWYTNGTYPKDDEKCTGVIQYLTDARKKTNVHKKITPMRDPQYWFLN